MEYDVPNVDNDTILDIEVMGAEIWALAPYTYIGVDDNGGMQNSGNEWRILRNDSERIQGIMAGAIARYSDNRCRAEVVIKRFHPWSHLVGQILSVIEEGGDIHDVEAPLTAISWDAVGRTTLFTGFAI